MKKKITSLVMAVCTIFMMFTFTVSATEYIPITYAGQIVDSITYNGVTVNAIYAPYNSIPNYGSDTTYCCAAFVKKFYSSVYGVSPYNLLSGRTPTVAGGSFHQTSSPKKGDIVRFNNEPHWAIVKMVNGNNITLIQQSAWWNNKTKGRANEVISASSPNYTFFRYSGYRADNGSGAPSNTPNTYTAYVANTPGNDNLAINSRPAAGSRIGVIPYGGAVTVNPSKNIGNWRWVTYNGVSGYSYSKYLSTSNPNPSTNSISSSSTAISEGIYTLSPKCASGMCLDINNASSASQANVQIWKSNNSNAQKFKIQKTGSAYTITALCSNMALDVYNGSSSSGTNVWQYTPNGTSAQKWYFESAGDGYYYIKSELGTYLDVNNAGTNNGTNVWAYKFNGSNAQKWKLIPASTPAPTTSVSSHTGRIVNCDSLYIRSGPNKNTAALGIIPGGASVSIDSSRTSGNWLYVTYNGISGYCYKNYIAQ